MATYHRVVVELPILPARYPRMKRMLWLGVAAHLLFTAPLALAGTPVSPVAATDNGEHFGHLPESFADVRKDGADVFENAEAIRAGTPTAHVGDKTFVAIRPGAKSLNVDGVKYYKTDQGWIARTQLSWYSPSEFAGEHIDGAALPTWAYPHSIGLALVARTAPNRKATVARKLKPRELVTVLEQRDGFVRLQSNAAAEEWLDARDIKQVVRVPRPTGVAADERWIDIDLDKQILVTYQGDQPVFATLVSTGKPKWETPSGVYRIVDKRERARMQAEGPTEQWNVAAVPWTMTFRKNFALHGTYWHDGFGRQRSHGCVNLAPADAHRIFEFITAPPPPVKAKAKAKGAHNAPALDAGTPAEPVVLGTPVQLRRGKEQTPAWRDYKGALVPAVVP
jgi:lipoprotein-anchoring transpeptidase ErfK/SrfK